MTWEKFDSGYYADAQEELFAALDASRLEVLRMTTLVDQAQAARQCDAENYRGEIQRLKAAYEPGGSGVPGYEATVDALESEHVEVLGLRARVAELKAELVLCKSTVAELRESDALVDGCHKREVDALKVRVEDLEAGLKKYGKHV